MDWNGSGSPGIQRGSCSYGVEYTCQLFPNGYSFIKWPLIIDRVVGPGVVNTDVTSQGDLLNIDQLINNGVVARQQTLRLSMSRPQLPSLDGRGYGFRLSVNDFPVGEFFLSGTGGSGEDFSFQIDSSKLRFASLNPATTGAAVPVKGVNWIQIQGTAGDTPLQAFAALGSQISELSAGAQATLEIKALYPVVLIHGWNAQADWFDGRSLQTGPSTRFRATLDPGIATELKARKIPFNMSMDLGEQVLIEDGAATLEAKLFRDVLERFGVQHAHFVAHSKGGLYVRSLMRSASRRALVDGIGRQYRLGVYSLTTLETPHRGNRMADPLAATINGEWPRIGGAQDLGVGALLIFNALHRRPPSEYRLPILSPQLPDDPREDVNSAKYFSTRAHADLNDNGVLNPLLQPTVPATGQTVFDELEGYNSNGFRIFQSLMFQATGRRLTTLPLQVVAGLLSWQVPRGTWAFVKNDAVVTIHRAHGIPDSQI